MGDVLVAEIAATYAGYGSPSDLLGAAREALFWLPVDDHQQPLCADAGLPWLYAFTSEAELAAFGRQRGAGDREWTFLTIRGARLFDEVLPACAGPTGVAVNVAGAQPMMFPPEVGDG